MFDRVPPVAVVLRVKVSDSPPSTREPLMPSPPLFGVPAVPPGVNVPLAAETVSVSPLTVVPPRDVPDPVRVKVDPDPIPRRSKHMSPELTVQLSARTAVVIGLYSQHLPTARCVLCPHKVSFLTV